MVDGLDLLPPEPQRPCCSPACAHLRLDPIYWLLLFSSTAKPNIEKENKNCWLCELRKGEFMAAPSLFLLRSLLGGEICAFEEKVADLGSIGFPRRVCVPDYCLGGPGLCQRRHSGKVICHRVTCHFSNLGPGTSKIYQTVCPPLLGNSIFQMTCISSDAPRGLLINRIWFGWISILRKPFFWIKSSTRKIELQMSCCCGILFKLAEPDFPGFLKFEYQRLSDSEEYDDAE